MDKLREYALSLWPWIRDEPDPTKQRLLIEQKIREGLPPSSRGRRIGSSKNPPVMRIALAFKAFEMTMKGQGCNQVQIAERFLSKYVHPWFRTKSGTISAGHLLRLVREGERLLDDRGWQHGTLNAIPPIFH
jgi:hypothetical protein